MAFRIRDCARLMAVLGACALMVSLQVRPADVGGHIADQQKASAMAAAYRAALRLAADKARRFMSVYSPVPIVGATGSIGAPLAIR